MPGFTTVPVQEAQLRTIPDDRESFSASTLTISTSFHRDRLENSALWRGKSLPLSDGGKRSGQDIYFWSTKTGEMSSPGLNAAIPDETDEGEQVTTSPHSHSLSRN
jgi:hypothetical protein